MSFCDVSGLMTSLTPEVSSLLGCLTCMRRHDILLVERGRPIWCKRRERKELLTVFGVAKATPSTNRSLPYMRSFTPVSMSHQFTG